MAGRPRLLNFLLCKATRLKWQNIDTDLQDGLMQGIWPGSEHFSSTWMWLHANSLESRGKAVFSKQMHERTLDIVSLQCFLTDCVLVSSCGLRIHPYLLFPFEQCFTVFTAFHYLRAAGWRRGDLWHWDQLKPNGREGVRMTASCSLGKQSLMHSSFYFYFLFFLPFFFSFLFLYLFYLVKLLFLVLASFFLLVRIESCCFSITKLQHDMQERVHYAAAELSLR